MFNKAVVLRSGFLTEGHTANVVFVFLLKGYINLFVKKFKKKGLFVYLDISKTRTLSD